MTNLVKRSPFSSSIARSDPFSNLDMKVAFVLKE